MEPSTELGQDIKLKKIEYAGLTKFPNPDGYEKDAENKLSKKRVDFYENLNKFFPEGKMYYPGSGADPIPFKAFGERVVYGSLRESDYFSMLKNPNTPKPIIYAESIKQTKNLDKLKAVYADIYRSPFPDKSFKLITINGSPVKFDESLVSELDRLLSDGGAIVVEDDQDLNVLNENTLMLEKVGFVPHQLDKMGGITSVMYMGFPENERIQAYQNSTRLKTDISKKTFLSHLQKGKDVSMSGHVFRVFQKPKSIALH